MNFINFYDPNEGIEKEESINNYKELFSEYKNNLPNLKESLFQLLDSTDLAKNKIDEYIDFIKKESEDTIDEKLTEIKEKYPQITYDQAVIIASYTVEAPDTDYSPYRILNKNMVSKNRKEGLKKVSKYLYLLLKTLRLLPKYTDETKCLYRCIKFKVNMMIDPLDEKVVPYITGKNKTFWTFTSTSPKDKTAYEFLGLNKKSGTIFTIKGKVCGYDITLFNKFHEEEILLEPERKYSIEYHFSEVNDILGVICKVKDTPLVLEENVQKNYYNYNISNGDIKITCRVSSKVSKIIYVSLDEPLSVLINKLQLKDEGEKFIFNGISYSVKSTKTFREIGLTSNSRIILSRPALAG